MTAYIYKSSEHPNKGIYIKYSNLEKLCDVLLKSEKFYKGFEKQIILSKPSEHFPTDNIYTKRVKCDWVIEIYDYWRE